MSYPNEAKSRENMQHERMAISRRKRLSWYFRTGLLRILTGLFVVGWVIALAYFFFFPLLPDLQLMKYRFQQNSPYNLGYNSTVGIFVALSPPMYDINGASSGTGGAVESGDSVAEGGSSAATIESVSSEVVVTANLESKNTRLGISSVGIDGRVVDGIEQDSMLRGFWHFPSSAEPGKRGNVVIIGHRFYKIPPDSETFYNLDKVVIGDKVQVVQEDKSYTYTVIETKVVEKYDTSVVDDTGDYRLTLVTCTPLWTSEKRLVVVALQDRVRSVI